VTAIWRRIVPASIRGLIRVACWLSLIGLGIMTYSILSPRPLPVILAMSVGQVIGGAGFACYIVAVVLDAARERHDKSSLPPVAVTDSDNVT
jgi:hypothetical protein